MKYQNYLREYRKKAGMSQQGVADKVGMSQQNYQRVESGRQGPSTDQALGLSGMYNTDPRNLFPDWRPVFETMISVSEPTSLSKIPIPMPAEMVEQVREINVMGKVSELATPTRKFGLKFRGGAEHSHQVTTDAWEKLEPSLSEDTGITTFKTDSHIVAVNREHLLGSCFGMQRYTARTMDDVEEGIRSSKENVTVTFVGDTSATAIRVLPDEVDIGEYDSSDLASIMALGKLKGRFNLQMMFRSLHLNTTGVGQISITGFLPDDPEGEDEHRFLFRLKDVATIVAPLKCVEPHSMSKPDTKEQS